MLLLKRNCLFASDQFAVEYRVAASVWLRESKILFFHAKVGYKSTTWESKHATLRTGSVQD